MNDNILADDWFTGKKSKKSSKKTTLWSEEPEPVPEPDPVGLLQEEVMDDDDCWPSAPKRSEKPSKATKSSPIKAPEDDLSIPSADMNVEGSHILPPQEEDSITITAAEDDGIDTPRSSVDDKLLRSKATEDLDVLQYVDNHKLLFLCCTVCARMVLVTVDNRVELGVLDNKDCRDLCGMLLTTCKADEAAAKQQYKPFVSEEIILGSRLHRIAEKISKRKVDILAKDSMVMYKPISSFESSVTTQWMIRSVHTKLGPESMRSKLVLPFVQGKFM